MIMKETEQLLKEKETNTESVSSFHNDQTDDIKLPIITNNEVLVSHETKQITDQIVKTNNVDEIKQLTQMFNVAQVKKNALRIVKLNKLLETVEDNIIERFEKYPDEISNKDLISYLQIISNQVDKSNENINTLEQKPLIQVNIQQNENNINIKGPDRESKETVKDAIAQLLALAQQEAKEETIYFTENNDMIDQDTKKEGD